MRELTVVSVFILVVLPITSLGIAGPMMGDMVKSQFSGWVSSYEGTCLGFDELSAGTQLSNQYSSKGVAFNSIRDPGGTSISKPVVVISYGGSMEISGEPSWGTGSDGRVAYQIQFSTPQRWAGIARHWDNFYTITNFYNSSGNVIYSFQGIQASSGFNKTFLGYLAETNDTGQWVSRIECDGKVDSNGVRQVGYADDLYFGTALPCSYIISPTSNSFTSQGGSGSVSVTAGAGCGWTASVDSGSSTWVSISSGTTGAGNGTVSYSVLANSTSSARTGAMTIAGQAFTITQQAAGSGCSYAIYPPDSTFGNEAGTGSVSIAASPGCSWTAQGDSGSSDWLGIVSGTSGTDNGQVNYSVQANDTGKTRTGQLTIGGQTFTVTQQATPTVNVGDINGDGDITSVDAAIVLQIVDGSITPTAVQTSAADADRDGKITTSDAQMILSWAAQRLGVSPPPILTDVVELPSLETKEAAIGDQGGEISLPSGVTLSIPKGQSKGTRTITLNRVDLKDIDDVGNNICYQIFPDVSYLAGVSLAVPLSLVLTAGENQNDIDGVVIAFYDSSARMNNMTIVPFTISDNSLVVNLSQLREGVSGSPDQGQLTVMIVPAYKSNTAQIPLDGEASGETGSSRKLEVPYFEQYTTHYCWAASSAMILNYAMGDLRLISGEKPWDIVDYFKTPDVSGNFMNWNKLLNPRFRYYYLTRGFWVGTSVWTSPDSLKNYLIEQLSDSPARPVWLAMSSEQHDIVVTGYEENSGVITFFVNDPAQGIGTRSWDNIKSKWGSNDPYLTMVISSDKQPPPAIAASVLPVGVVGNQAAGLIFASPISKRVAYSSSNIRFTWYDETIMDKGFMGNNGTGTRIRAIPHYYFMQLNLRVADTRVSGDPALVAHTTIKNSSGKTELDDLTNFSIVAGQVVNVLVQKDLPSTLEGHRTLSTDLVEQQSLVPQDVLRIPIEFDDGIGLSASIKDQKVVLEWPNYPYKEDFDSYGIYCVDAENSQRNGEFDSDKREKWCDADKCTRTIDPSLCKSNYYAVIVKNGSDPVITSDVVQPGRLATANIAATLNAVTVVTDATGKQTKANPKDYGYTFYGGTYMIGQWTGNVFKGSWQYGSGSYWGEITITFDDVYEKATKILTFSGSDNEMDLDGTKGDTETIGGMGGTFTKTSSGTYDKLTFEVSGLQVCDFIDGTQMSYHHFQKSSAGEFTEDDTEFKCNENSHLLIEVDVNK